MKLKYIFILILIISLPIFILAFIPYKTLVRLELVVTETSFESVQPINNFFSLENSHHKTKKISVQSYDSLYYYSDGIKNQELGIISSDITDKLTFYNAGINSMPITEKSTINIQSNRYDPKKYIIQIIKNNVPLSFISNNDTLLVKINNNPINKISNNSDNIAVVTPSEEMLKLFISMNNEATLEEEEIIMAKNITFQKNINGNLYPSIKSGKILFLDIDKEYVITKNSSVLLDPNTKFEIMDLRINQGNVYITLEGFTSNVLYGLNKKNIAPSLLFYLSNNNFLLTLANTFLVILTFFISIIKFKNEAK